MMEDFDSRVEQFAGLIQKQLEAYFAQNFPELNVPDTIVEKKDRPSRYVRIVRAEPHTRSVVCFVDRTNGNILKGNWKAPVKNGVRGNIYRDDFGMSAMSGHTLKYLR